VKETETRARKGEGVRVIRGTSWLFQVRRKGDDSAEDNLLRDDFKPRRKKLRGRKKSFGGKTGAGHKVKGRNVVRLPYSKQGDRLKEKNNNGSQNRDLTRSLREGKNKGERNWGTRASQQTKKVVSPNPAVREGR